MAHDRRVYSITKAASRPKSPGEWNTMGMVLNGPRTTVILSVTEYEEGKLVQPREHDYEPTRGCGTDKGHVVGYRSTAGSRLLPRNRGEGETDLTAVLCIRCSAVKGPLSARASRNVRM